MGRAIVRQPQVFLMDEPLSNLDAKLRVQMRAEIAKLQQQLGTTTLYVTHDQVEAMTMGDRVAVMNKGVLQQVAQPQQLYDRPANLFVAAFIGTPPMNLLEGTVTSANGDYTLSLGSHTLPLAGRALTAYPGVKSQAGKPLVVGIRSEALHPSAERSDLPTLDAQVELVESLGSESMAYFHVNAPAVWRQGAVADDPAVEASADGDGAIAQPNLVASFPPQVMLKLGERVQVAVDVGQLHFFDRETGAPLR
jgi:multiple sugar transport system ATP-binding protein